MEVPLSPDRHAKLSQLASESGCDAPTLVAKIIGDYVSELERFEAAVKEGEDDFARGNYITHAEMGARIEQWLKE